MITETRYTESDGVSIAYQVIGSGPIDVVYVPGFVSHLEYTWELPAYARFLQRLASFSRLIMFDKRGTGLSDRVSDKELPTLEQRMDDVRAVMDAAGSQSAALFGVSEGGPMCALFAATYPERTAALVMYAAYASGPLVEDSPWRRRTTQILSGITISRRYWGSALGLRMFARLFAPSTASDKDYLKWYSTWLRLSASPGAAASLMLMNAHVDIRGVLPAIRVPTLLLHRRDDRLARIEQSRYMAEQIPGAHLIELPGVDHFVCAGDADSIVDHVEEFLTGTHTAAEQERILATVLFTDIVGSTERAATLGDRRWRELLEMHNSVVRQEIARWRGREVSTEGDSFLATFDGPARAIRCARGITAAVHELGIDVRTGLHTGECEVMGDDIGGIAVHIGARVKALADAREVFVSSTVKDLVTGSGIEFRSRGTHVLKGVPGEWRLFSVEQA